VDPGRQMVVSSFDPNSFNANRDSGISAEEQPLVIGDPEAAPVPVGLSHKEIARLRAGVLSSPQPRNFRISALNMSQSTSPLNAVTESGESPYDTRRLHSEFESLRREVERLRAEGSRAVVTAPPSYTEGDG
jgi:hypothetical protein